MHHTAREGQGSPLMHLDFPRRERVFYCSLSYIIAGATSRPVHSLAVSGNMPVSWSLQAARPGGMGVC